MKKLKFQTPKGMHDILPEEQKYFQKIFKIVEETANFHGFGKIDTPILEQAEAFSKSVGVNTDIVEKEMYTLKTKGKDLLTLRPEGTVPVVRAFIEHGMASLPKPIKLWYFGPFFRHERPQAGRYRQFNQFGFEVLGEKSPIIDAQIIQIFYRILKKLKFGELLIEINSIGDSQCRSYYRKVLLNYLKRYQSALCFDCKRRFKENPLRILDCKQLECQRIVSQAPQTIDHLCEECNEHFKSVLEFLDELELPYNLNPSLVRGLDYYTKTVFEIFASIPTSQTERIEQTGGEERLSLLGGGRYDGLTKLLGGKDTPGCGAAAGIERIISLIKDHPLKYSYSLERRIFLAQLGDLAKRKGLKLVQEFEKVKIPIVESFGRDSLKAQLKIADKLNIGHVLILGQKESLEGTIIIRTMKTGKQKVVKIEKVVAEMKKILKKR